MKLIKISFYLVLTLILLGTFINVQAKGVEGTKGKVLKTTGSPAATKFNINNISTFFQNDGQSDLSNTGDSGFQFPIGSGKTVFFESGFLYGGLVNKEWRVSGSTYNRGQVPGRILPGGVGESPSLPNVRIFRVRRDYKDPQADYSKEILDENKTKDAIYAQYDKDWTEWPAKRSAVDPSDQGAPFDDKDGNGFYDPAKDIPGVPGSDQTIFFVANDTDPTQSQKLYGSVGLGLEMQATIWGYNQQTALGDALFRKYTLINKGGNKVDSMYVCMWSDPDLGGDAGDDFAGSDTTLSLGFIYNGDDSDPSYGQYIPSSGFDFMQGPIIPGNATDKAIFKGKYRSSYTNMPMTAFFMFTQSFPVYGDPALGSYQNGALQVKRLFEGKVGTTGTKFVDPTTGKTTKFFTPGDPVTGKGWVDGILFPKQDRRIGTVSGPFTLAAGDTQEVVVGQLAAGGVAPVTRLGSVAKLKFQDKQVQRAYDNFFVVPSSPKAPTVSLDPVTKIGKASEFDQKLIIAWGEDEAAVKQTEGYDNLGYKFEGYVVYQLPSLTAQLTEGKVVATYDLSTDPGTVISVTFDPNTNQETKTVSKYGSNSGISRSIIIDKDYIRGGIPLANGTQYYYVVSSYVVHSDPDAVPNVLESLSARILATPHSPNPGTAYTGTAGQKITATHSVGGSDGVVIAKVIDPSKVTGASHSVTFKDNPAGGVFWTLKRGTTVLLDNQTNLSGDNDYLLTDGLQVVVSGPPEGVKDWSISKGTRRFTWAGGAAGFGLEGFEGAVGYASPRSFFGDGVMKVGPGELKNVVLKLAKVNSTVDYNPPFDLTDANMSYGYRFLRGNTAAAAKPEFAPFIINKTGGYAFQKFEKNVPLSAWNVDNPAQPKRLAVAFLENNAANGLVDGKYWPGDYTKYDNTAGSGPREWLFILDTPYSETQDPVIASELIGSDARVMYYITWARRGAVPFSPGASGDDEFQILGNKAITKTDVFTFTSPSVVTNNLDLALQEVEKINVFPNPYYGVNPREVNKYQRFVTFSHLPQKATLRIFNLAGQLVRILQKDSPSQFTTWDLVNDSSFPVASGLYIVHVDMPDLGTTKIIKLAVIQEQQILDHF
ncbi:MAG: T9SS type A sorting domain-containing protein [Melioribacteraceae bacterium]